MGKHKGSHEHHDKSGEEADESASKPSKLAAEVIMVVLSDMFEAPGFPNYRNTRPTTVGQIDIFGDFDFGPGFTTAVLGVEKVGVTFEFFERVGERAIFWAASNRSPDIAGRRGEIETIRWRADRVINGESGNVRLAIAEPLPFVSADTSRDAMNDAQFGRNV